MSIQDLGSLGEFVSSIAVVVSLIYLAIQVKHNSVHMQENVKALKREETNETMRGFSNLRRVVIESETVADLLARAEEGSSVLSEPEKRRVISYYAEWIWLNYHTWSRAQDGYMNPSETSSNLVAKTIAIPLGRVAWDNLRPMFETQFVDEVEIKIEAGDA